MRILVDSSSPLSFINTKSAISGCENQLLGWVEPLGLPVRANHAGALGGSCVAV